MIKFENCTEPNIIENKDIDNWEIKEGELLLNK